MIRKTKTKTPKGTTIIGSDVAALQAALTLAQLGIKVNLITILVALGQDNIASSLQDTSSLDERFLWPLLLQVKNHRLITLYTNSRVDSIEGEKGNFELHVIQHPRFIHEDICTACRRCITECSAKVTTILKSERITHTAIHAPLLNAKSVPSAYMIDKHEFAPCRVSCPLGINVQGFVSLLANGKIDKALALINESAPLAGILGRVCIHPCESNCNRAKIDSAVSTRDLHRFAADNATGKIIYNSKLPAQSKKGKVAIVGSGPAGLAASWELARRGYSPTIFESHGVAGGMMATGIPRFRLPREIREREIEAIKNMGVDIRTGITVGRDVTFAYLKERGYQSCFLAIGTQQNNKVNIPGEELQGVVDCISLLLTLNLMVDTFVGSNIVIIGDGNAAIDSARTAIRRNKGTVKILCWTISDEISSAQEEVQEALQEGVSIIYETIPVEILGDNGKVTGIRCQRTKLTNEVMPNGRHRPEPLPDTEFIIDADHVVVAIGQSPNAAQLNIKGLNINSNSSVILVNPLTLETGIPGVFAGGDCVTGPNNVLEAMAAGLRAAESIDRYLQGQDIEVGRSLEPPQTAEIDIETIEATPYKRASMPSIRLQKRINSFEETTTGLSTKIALREAQRCLNCSLCSQCMECNRTCELDAIFHDDSIKHFDIEAHTILEFPSSEMENSIPVNKSEHTANTNGIHVIYAHGNRELADQLIETMALAFKSAAEISPDKSNKEQEFDKHQKINIEYPRQASTLSPDNKHTGVFLCRCGDSISSIIDFKTIARRLSDSTRITCIREINQCCTETGAKYIANIVEELQLNRIVLAACRCCNLEQLCYSCTDRRMLCQKYINQYLIPPQNTIVEYVNIREQCAWIHKNDVKGATRKAMQLIYSGINRVLLTSTINTEKKPVLPNALIIGGGIAGITAAKSLASQGYRVEFVTGQISKQEQAEPINASLLLDELPSNKVIVRPRPDIFKLNGSPGNYEAILEYGSDIEQIITSVVLADMEEFNNENSPLYSSPSGRGLLRRIISHTDNSRFLSNVIGSDFLRDITIAETSGIFLLQPDKGSSPDKQILQGLAAATRISIYLERSIIGPRTMAVNIDNKLCRACGNCADLCPYIELKESDNGKIYAYVDKILCLGCGACITICPSGAITQPHQSDKQIFSSLHSMLTTSLN